MKIKMLIDRKPKRLGVGVAEVLVSYLIVKMSEKNKFGRHLEIGAKFKRQRFILFFIVFYCVNLFIFLKLWVW